MINLHCPQCDIHRFCVKNKLEEIRVVTVNDKNEVIAVHADESLEGFDLTMLYCLGCSWSGSPQSLTKGKHK
ncbi:MAG: hypothetical protein P4L34_09255 [Paludibacter sp.]|nr:hypothetical protein [Paludibacter sp.]